MAQGVKKAIKPKPNQKRLRAPAPMKKLVENRFAKKRQAKAQAGRTHEGDIIAAMPLKDRIKSKMFRREAEQVDVIKSGGTISRKGKLKIASTPKQLERAAGVKARTAAAKKAKKGTAVQRKR